MSPVTRICCVVIALAASIALALVAVALNFPPQSVALAAASPLCNVLVSLHTRSVASGSVVGMLIIGVVFLVK